MPNRAANQRPAEAGRGRNRAQETHTDEDVVLDVRKLSKRFTLENADGGKPGLFRPRRGRPFWALKDVSFQLRRGDRLGIIGRNGAGKSTLLKVLSRVLMPTSGEADVYGRLTSLLEVGTGFNPELSGRRNIYLNGALNGMDRAEIDKKIDDIIDFSEIGPFIEEKVKLYSTGMRSRLGFAVAAHLEPDILMLDEVLAVGDMAFQRKCLGRMSSLTSDGRTLIFVSHSMESVSRFCNQAMWLHEGSVKAHGDIQSVTGAYVEAMGVQSEITPDDAPDVQRRAKERNGTVGDATLISAKIVDRDGNKKSIFGLEEQVGISFTYSVSTPAIYVPAVGLVGLDGQLLCWCVHPDTDADRFRGADETLTVTAWLPRHLLNVGIYKVNLAVVGPDHTPLERYILADQVLSFNMVEADAMVPAARGTMPREFPGNLRPMLEWSYSA